MIDTPSPVDQYCRGARAAARVGDHRLAPLRPLAVWAHGSQGGGDCQEGRSGLALVAVLPGPLTPPAYAAR
ncbi:hypothetical protein [Streptomyces sp. NPDC001781]